MTGAEAVAVFVSPPSPLPACGSVDFVATRSKPE